MIKSDVVVVSPQADRDPDAAGALIATVEARRGCVAVRVRPFLRRPRLPDLVSDALDALERVGTSTVTRKHETADLMRLVPFLLTGDTHTLVVAHAEWLDADGTEELIAAAGLGAQQLWLVLGAEPTTAQAAILTAHAPAWLTLPQAHAHWASQPGTPRRKRLAADALRHDVAQRLKTARTADRWALIDTHTRLTVHPAATALREIGITDAGSLARVRLGDLAPDTTRVHLAGTDVEVPPHLRPALQRQRLHSLMIGQRPHEQFLTFDGSPVSPNALRTN